MPSALILAHDVCRVNHLPALTTICRQMPHGYIVARHTRGAAAAWSPLLIEPIAGCAAIEERCSGDSDSQSITPTVYHTA